MSDDYIPFPALLRERSAAAAAQDEALRQGVVLSQQVAVKVAAAVLEFADDEFRVRLEVAPEFWPGHREDVLRRLRRQLAVELGDKELLPTTLPREVITYPDKPWENVRVELVVPVRHPAAS